MRMSPSRQAVQCFWCEPNSGSLVSAPDSYGGLLSQRVNGREARLLHPVASGPADGSFCDPREHGATAAYKHPKVDSSVARRVPR